MGPLGCAGSGTEVDPYSTYERYLGSSVLRIEKISQCRDEADSLDGNLAVKMKVYGQNEAE